ncbi:MAG: hypothetical protein GXO83_02510 [Chlorobi bacterium]|nr:hypothetical protein [Chlorobiota bacterium]
MTAFLEYIAGYILKNHPEHLHRVAMIFPNRRAGLWFQHHLSHLAGSTVWSPQIFTIRNLMEHLTGMSVTDTVPLVMELYRVWSEVLPGEQQEPLDSFYPWGEMLLGDFDDLDKYLVNADDLFKNLKSLKTIEISYLDDEQKKLIRQFWDHFPGNRESDESRAFASLWEHLGKIYTLFNQRLAGKEMAYEGRLYRKVAGMAEDGKLPGNRWEKVCFAGFHALTPAEEKLFEEFKRSTRGVFFWDYDVAYLENPEMSAGTGRDAGTFIRRYKNKFPPPENAGIFNNLTVDKKRIEIYTAPARTAQSAVVKKLIGKWNREPGFRAERTALVLADEQLLLPVVHAVPAEIEEINITMGFPVKNTPVFGLFSLVMELHIHALRDKKSLRFHTTRILEIMHHPVVNHLRSPVWKQWEERVKKLNILWIDPADLPDTGILKPLFEPEPDAFMLSRHVTDVLYYLVVPPESDHPEDQAGNGFNVEAYYQLYILINRLNDSLGDYRDLWPVLKPGKETGNTFILYLKLLTRMAGTVKIPFYGEPLAGLQVMGMLETRLLDFDRVILLSVNEKALPKGISAVNSFIPYNLRKGFGMPTFDYHDTVYNYYFLRLIQRAREVALVYHTDAEGGQTGEMSRFIPQLEYLLGMTLTRQTLAFTPEMKTAPQIRIAKDDPVMKKLKAILAEGISPSALNTYIDCSLRFYFRYIADIREPDELTDDVDQALMGTLYHKAMELIYRPYLEKTVTPEMFDRLTGDQTTVEEVIDQAFQEIFPSQGHTVTDGTGGFRNILKHAVRKFILKTLRFDKCQAPFTIKELEEPVACNLETDNADIAGTVILKGKIDRIDIRDGLLHIIDYKTGSPGQEIKNIGTLFDPSDKKRNGGAFQIFLYSWMRYRNNNESIQPQLYFLRMMHLEKPDMRLILDNEKLNDYRDIHAEFEDSLSGLILKMLNREIPFEQTEIIDRCKYCPFADTCRDRE